MERKSKPPARCCFLFYFGGNRGDYSTHPGYMNDTHAAAFCFGMPLLVPAGKIPSRRCRTMPLYIFMYCACWRVCKLGDIIRRKRNKPPHQYNHAQMKMYQFCKTLLYRFYNMRFCGTFSLHDNRILSLSIF